MPTLKWVEIRGYQQLLFDIHIPWLHLRWLHIDIPTEPVQIGDKSPGLQHGATE